MGQALASESAEMSPFDSCSTDLIDKSHYETGHDYSGSYAAGFVVPPFRPSLEQILGGKDLRESTGR